MLMFVLIGLLFVLIGVTGLQFAYLFYIDRLDRERKKHIRSLERRARRLTAEVEKARRRVADQELELEMYRAGLDPLNETWADVLEDN